MHSYVYTSMGLKCVEAVLLLILNDYLVINTVTLVAGSRWEQSMVPSSRVGFVTLSQVPFSKVLTAEFPRIPVHVLYVYTGTRLWVRYYYGGP